MNHLGKKIGIVVFLSINMIISGNANATECVVLLHGFGRSSYSLNKINSNLVEQGYKTLTIDYPSRKFHVFQLAEQFILPKISDEIKKCHKVHFVGYSMGSIITRYILANHRMANLGRVVFIAPPNQGVETVNVLGKYIWFKTLFGPAVQDLACGSKFLTSLPQTLDYETGIISGNFSVNPFTSLFIIPGEDDGTISVETTKIQGMKEHIIINSTHTMLLYNTSVVEYVANFLKFGNFTASGN